jgi:hypothetical protein
MRYIDKYLPNATKAWPKLELSELISSIPHENMEEAKKLRKNITKLNIYQIFENVWKMASYKPDFSEEISSETPSANEDAYVLDVPHEASSNIAFLLCGCPGMGKFQLYTRLNNSSSALLNVFTTYPSNTYKAIQANLSSMVLEVHEMRSLLSLYFEHDAGVNDAKFAIFQLGGYRNSFEKDFLDVSRLHSMLPNINAVRLSPHCDIAYVFSVVCNQQLTAYLAWYIAELLTAHIRKLEREISSDTSLQERIRIVRSVKKSQVALKTIENINMLKAAMDSVVSGISKNSLSEKSIKELSCALHTMSKDFAKLRPQLIKHYTKKSES